MPKQTQRGSQIKCICEVVFKGYHYTEKISYCPLHKAAPELLEACKLWIKSRDQADTALEGKAWFAVKNSIAKAEGRA